MYLPLRVSTSTRSPTLTNSGTCTVAPVSSVAGLLPPPEAVSPRTPGSVSVTSRSTALGSCRPPGWSSMIEQLDRVVGLGPAQLLRELGLGHRQLLIGLAVHEVGVLTVGVEELHPPDLGADRAELLAGAEGPVDHVAVRGAPQLGAHERRPLARVDVLELEHLEDGAVDLDVVAALELVRGDHRLQA